MWKRSKVTKTDMMSWTGREWGTLSGWDKSVTEVSLGNHFGKGAEGKVTALDIIERAFICLVSKSSSLAKSPLWQEVSWRSYRGRCSWWRSWQQWATKTLGTSPLWWKVGAPPAGRPWNQSTQAYSTDSQKQMKCTHKNGTTSRQSFSDIFYCQDCL